MKWQMLKIWFAAAGATLAPFVGGWDEWFSALCVMIVIDYCTGILCAIKDRKLNSKVGFTGLCKKAAYILAVIVGTKLDALAPGGAPFFRQAILMVALGTEGISLVENFTRLGFLMPAVVTRYFEQVKDKGNNTTGSAK